METTKAVVSIADMARMVGLRSLGLTTATLPEVATAVKELFPGGVNDGNRGQVLRAVFLRLKRQDTADNVGR